MRSNLIRRRDFLELTAAGFGSALFPFAPALTGEGGVDDWDPDKPFPAIGNALTVQPVFMYRLPTPRKQTSWKSWGGVQTEEAANEEVERISTELNRLAHHAGFPLRVSPVIRVTSPEAAAKLSDTPFDVMILYACTGGGDLLQACLRAAKHSIVFVRHSSGPVYYWYEALSVKHLQTGMGTAPSGDTQNPLRAHVDDAVVDDYHEVLWRLRALFGVKNLLGTRIVALGGPWGKYAPDAPDKARERFKIEIIDVSYDDFAPRLKRTRENPSLVADAQRSARKYLALPHTELKTEQSFVINAFILHRLFRELMQEHQAPAFTIKSCMGTIIPMSETTACLTLALLNDEGSMAFCESDFVIIPAGILLRYISGKPVFLHNSTFPHKGLVTCAHCTSPRRLDGKRYEPTLVTTHYESDYGAAPKVEMPVGQQVTFIDPEYSTTRWLSFRGKVVANPFYQICRSQQDVELEGDWRRLISEARDSHWMMVYGDYLREVLYAARKLGLECVDISTRTTAGAS